jgi:hypothetical protein
MLKEAWINVSQFLHKDVAAISAPTTRYRSQFGTYENHGARSHRLAVIFAVTAKKGSGVPMEGGILHTELSRAVPSQYILGV